MFSHQHQHLFYPLQSILSWYWQALANIASNRWQSNSILQTIPNPNSPFFEETQWWLATSCLLCKIASIEGSVQLLVGDAAPIIGQLVTHTTQHTGEKPNLLPFFCDLLKSVSLLNVWEAMLAPIIGFAQIGGGEEDEGSGSERLVSKMGQEGQSAEILVRIRKDGPERV